MSQRPFRSLFLLLILALVAPAWGQTVLSDRSASGALTAAWNGTLPQPANTAVLISLPSSGSFSVQLTGTFSATVQFEALIDQPRATWLAIKGTPFTAGGTTVSAATATGAWVFPGGGVKVFRVRCSAYTSGTIQVGVVASAAINTGTVAGGGGGGGTATSVSAADEAAFTVGTDPFNPIGGLFNDSAAALTSGQQGIRRLTPNRAGHVNLRNNAGTEIGTSTTPVRVDPTGTTPQPVSIAQVPAAAAAADGFANPTTTQIEMFPFLWNGTTWDRWKDMAAAQAQTTFTGVPAMAPFYLDTTGTPSIRRAVTAASTTVAITGTQVPASAGMIYDGTNFQDARQASAAQATTGAGLTGVGPLHQTVVFGANPTAVTAGQFAYPPATRGGIPFGIGGHPNTVTIRANYAAAQTDTAIITVATGTKIVVTACTITASNANTVNVSAVIGFGTVNTPTTTGVFLADSGIPAGGGVNRGDGAGILGAGADDEDVRITSGVATGGSIDVVITYFTTPS